jgi:hypothetical protein
MTPSATSAGPHNTSHSKLKTHTQTPVKLHTPKGLKKLTAPATEVNTSVSAESVKISPASACSFPFPLSIYLYALR